MLSLSAEKIRRSWVNHGHPVSVDGTGIHSLPVTYVEIERLREIYGNLAGAFLGNFRLEHQSAESFLSWLRDSEHPRGPPMLFGTLWGYEEVRWWNMVKWHVLSHVLSNHNDLWHVYDTMKDTFTEFYRHKICKGIGLTVSPVEWWAHAELLSEGAAARCCDCWGCQLVGALHSLRALTSLSLVNSITSQYFCGRFPISQVRRSWVASNIFFGWMTTNRGQSVIVYIL